MILRLVCALLLLTPLLAQSPQPRPKPEGFPVSGVVFDSVTRQPMADARISIDASHGGDYSSQVFSQSDGHFSFTGVPAGKYILTGNARGYRTQGFHQHGDYFIGVAVGPNLESQGIRFPLVPDARIEGTVSDDDGEAVRNASVTLFRRSFDTGTAHTVISSNLVTDDRGHYLFSHLGPGIYYVAVAGRPWFAQYFNPGEKAATTQDTEERAQLDFAYPLTFYPAATDSSGATPIVLHAGDRFTADITLQALPAVHLRVKPGAGTEPNSPSMNSFPRVSQRVFEGTVIPVLSSQASCFGSNGCEYTGIAPGRYLLQMQVPGARRNGGWYKEMDLSGTVELDPGEYPPLVKVTGALSVQGAQRPRDKIYVVLINRDSTENLAAEVTPKWTFDFSDVEIRPGVYDIAVNTEPGFQVNGLLASGAKLNGATLDLSGSSNVQLAVTITRALGRVTGTVLRDDKPYAGAMVVLVPRNPTANFALFRRDQSDSDGTFNLREVLPGAYSVIALQDGWEMDWANPATIAPYLKNAVPVEVSGEANIGIKVPLQ